MKFLWTDDKTGKFSDTTLRTWVLFLLFIAITIYEVFFDSQITQEDITILNLLSMSFLGGGALYLGKRVFSDPKYLPTTVIKPDDDVEENLKRRKLL